ncbi:hypothetical protein AB4212_66395, partial [Streptomyces sp. 2MCAF27]
LSPCPNNVALGTRKEGDLRNFAESRDFTHFLDQSRDGSLASVRNVAHEHPHVRIHVVMDGWRNHEDQLSDDVVELFDAAYAKGKGNNWYTTEREMAHLGDAVKLGNRSWDSITFYFKGKVVEIPHPPMLGG